MGTDSQRGRVDEADPATASLARVEIGTQRHQDGGDQLHKAVVADQVRKILTQVLQDVLRIERFKIPIMGLMEVNQKGHDFTRRQLPSPVALDLACLKQGLIPAGSKGLPKIIDMTKQFE